MLRKIISGGQTGADQGGLRAGKKLGLETGGWIPKGFLTELGFCPELGERFGLVEHSSPKYPPRTFSNAKDSDGTIRFAINFETAGEKCTLKAIDQYKKPHFDIDVADPHPAKTVAEWIESNKIEVLNVAGNREATFPGIGEFVENFLIEVGQYLRAEHG